jgi:hypothetical protein
MDSRNPFQDERISRLEIGRIKTKEDFKNKQLEVLEKGDLSADNVVDDGPFAYEIFLKRMLRQFVTTIPALHPVLFPPEVELTGIRLRNLCLVQFG